jgi:hypothetical protein
VKSSLRGILWITGIALLLFGYSNCGMPNSSFDPIATDIASYSSAKVFSFSYNPSPMYVGNSATLYVSGGTAPYTFTLFYGVGSVNGNTFYSGTDGSATIQVSDAAGMTDYYSIYVYTPYNPSGVTTVQPDFFKLIPLYRFSGGGKHFFSTNISEGTAAGMNYDGPAFNLFTTSTAERVPLYRCYFVAMGAHFVSGDSSCGGNTVEGIYGYANAASTANSLPIYSFYNASYDYLVTTSYAEGATGAYTYIGILGYAPTQ